VEYKDNNLESECLNIFPITDFSSYMAESNLICNIGFAQFTLKTLEALEGLKSVVEEDRAQLVELFYNKTNGLTQEQINELLKPMEQFAECIVIDDKNLIERYKSKREEEKELIARILFGRESKDAERFFDLYKGILIK